MLFILIAEAIVFGIFAFLCFSNGNIAKYPDVTFNQMHHEYIGLGLVLLAWIVSSIPLGLLGVLVSLDDTYQHFVQLESDKPTFQSPLHKLYGCLVHQFPFLSKIAAYLNLRLK
jgi:hypothetical protein